MPVMRASDKNLPIKEKLYRLLGRMLNDQMSDTMKKKCCEEFTSYIKGADITKDWLSDFGLTGSTGVDRGMGYVDIYVPVSHIPEWYRVQFQKDHPNEVMPQPSVRFYLTMRETHGSETPGIGPILDNPTKG